MKNFFLFLTIVFTSCGNDTKIKEDLKQLSSAPIKIPEFRIVVFNGDDTSMIDNKDIKAKFIVYIDSAVCTSCVVNKMTLWEPYLKYAETYNGKLKFYFIFHPSDRGVANFRNTMMLNPINYPMLIDLNGDFERLNPHLPKNKAMHTFLLDENNKVILVGNPLYNKEIEKLFYKKTQELLTK